MTERQGAITFKGGPMTLLGPEIKVGDKLPAFKVTGQDLADITPEKYAGKVLVISVVPSIDTPVCATQTRKFNEQAAKLSDAVRILTVSLDLPFAAKRFCAAEGISAVETGSDYKHQQFGTDFGVKIKELGLLCRAVFVVDKGGKVVHAEYVKEATNEPDYEAALAAAKQAA
ncbi:MAG TPA: thiol peroxidase [Phycisphaerae bacterium]|nr:thiol peroxidase [Phycisphaerae bacterium]